MAADSAKRAGMPSTSVEKKILTPLDMEALGAALASEFQAGDIVKITGPLGAGKTTLVRGIVSGMGGNTAEVHSPTFSLVHEYCTKSLRIINCDFYRLPKDSDLADLGGPEFFDGSNLYLIEWPERIETLLSDIPNRLLGVDLRVDANCHSTKF